MSGNERIGNGAPAERSQMYLLCSDGKELGLYQGVNLSIGRHPDCDYRCENQRVSARHCTVTVDVSGILLRDESSNGTFVNDKRVGKGKEQRLKDGDSVALVMKDVSMTLMVKSSELHNEETGTIDGSDFEHLDRTLPASLEDDEDDKKEAAAERGAEAVEDFAAACSQAEAEGVYASGVDKNSGGASAKAAKQTVGGMEDQITCLICCGILYKSVTCIPCMHNFCSACLSQWLDTNEGRSCPQCRGVVEGRQRNHTLEHIVESFHKENPGRRRPDAELREMDERSKLTDEMLRVTRKRRLASEDYDSDDMSSSEGGSSEDYDIHDLCYNCNHAAPDAYSCPATTTDSHAICNICMELVPRRRPAGDGGVEGSAHPPTSCPGCHVTCCGAYFSWMARSAEVNAAGIPRCWSFIGNRTDLSTTVLQQLPPEVFSWNLHERRLLESLLAEKRMSNTRFLQICFQKARDGEMQIPDSTPDWRGLPISDLAQKPWLCPRCVGTLLSSCALAWRMQMPKDDLPREEVAKDDCHWGYACSTLMELRSIACFAGARGMSHIRAHTGTTGSAEHP